MAVTLELPILEVERLVAVARGLPGERRRGEPPRFERLSLEATLAGVVVARPAAHADVEFDPAELVVAEPLQGVAAVGLFLSAGLLASRLVGGRIVRGVGGDSGPRLAFGGLGLGECEALGPGRITRASRGLVFPGGGLPSLVGLHQHRRHRAQECLGHAEECPPFRGAGGRAKQAGRQDGAGGLTPAWSAPRCSWVLPA